MDAQANNGRSAGGRTVKMLIRSSQNKRLVFAAKMVFRALILALVVWGIWSTVANRVG